MSAGTQSVWLSRELGPTRLVLVLPLDLENIEKVGGGGVDGNEVLVRRGLDVGQRLNDELVGALDKTLEGGNDIEISQT